ncbi:helix-turn-helix transcriptional regulator [Sinorhizobium sp. RAC02]|uniref:helix-turn-helix transcriptional regulator n=1 Tax=Sinorhizobium sp. RAC02 TaxID=1842534 RepID=UPI000857783A|nr:helix-turn-helix transcriptional regulator [Sinorhizobium sp. RAC02]AOF89608.1 helix-turn-helix family protein [Sinorhizobium sp. RAC02]
MNAHLTSLGDAIRDARQAKGLKQHHIAKALDVTVQAVSQWERDVTHPDPINMIKLDEMLGTRLAPQHLAGLLNIVESAPKPADRLRAAREEIFETASEAARAIGVAIPTYIHHENGTRDFDVAAASTYAVAFDVSAAWLLGVQVPFGTISPEPTVGTVPKLAGLRDEIDTAYDLMTALDKTGDGIGGDVGHGVSAVALAARAALDNARDMLKAMEGRSK